MTRENCAILLEKIIHLLGLLLKRSELDEKRGIPAREILFWRKILVSLEYMLRSCYSTKCSSVYTLDCCLQTIELISKLAKQYSIIGDKQLVECIIWRVGREVKQFVENQDGREIELKLISNYRARVKICKELLSVLSIIIDSKIRRGENGIIK